MNPLGVAIHLQDDHVKCGKACAQMIARFLNPTAPIHQQGDFTSASAPVAPWNSSPDQVCDMLNQFRPASVPKYVVTAAGTPQEAMAVAMANVDAPAGPRRPVVALTIHGGHWEVVHGFSGPQAAPTVHVRNPLPDRKQLFHGTPLPLHADNDTCHTENIVSAGSVVPADEVVAWTTWIGSYFTVCTFEPPPWKSRYVVVAPARPSKTKTKPPLVHPPPKRPRMTEPLLPSHRASGFARDGLLKSGLLDQPGWRDSVQNVPTDGPERSVLVHRLDGHDPYYLVPLVNDKDKDLGALVGVSAVDGELLFSRLNPPRALVDTLFTLDEVRQQVAGGDSYTTRLVWTPVRESFFSPYFPFAEFSDAGGPRFYVRLFDRTRFDSFGEPGTGYTAG